MDSLENLHSIGRNGLHRYDNQDHAMLSAILAVENIVKDSGHDLWTVNTEKEYHEVVMEEKEEAKVAAGAAD